MTTTKYVVSVKADSPADEEMREVRAVAGAASPDIGWVRVETFQSVGTPGDEVVLTIYGVRLERSEHMLIRDMTRVLLDAMGHKDVAVLVS